MPRSSFEKSQAFKILSCYNTDDTISKGGKPAAVGDIRIWSGKKYVKLATGWVEYNEKTNNLKVITNSRRVIGKKETDRGAFKHERQFSVDQLIQEHISSLSEEERNSKLQILDKKIDLLNKKLKIVSSTQSSGYGVEDQSHINSLNEQIQGLEKKKSELKYSGLNESDLRKQLKDVSDKKQELLKTKHNHIELRKLIKEEQELGRVIQRKFGEKSVQKTTSNTASMQANEQWNENDLEDNVEEDEIDNFKNDHFRMKKNKLNEALSNINNTTEILKQIISKQNVNSFVQPDDKIEVTFHNNKTVDRTWKQLNDFLEQQMQTKSKDIVPIKKIKL